MATEEVGIRLSLAGRREAAAGLKESKDGLEDLGDAAETAGQQAESAEKKFSRTRSVLGGLGKGALVLGGLFGSVAVAAGSIGLKTAASMETAKIGFTTMLGGAKRADRFLRNLASFAAKTPFEFPELQTAASRLVSAGIETNKIIPIMTTLGDVTAGMGTGSEGITRATNALQQMTAAGRISAEDLNQLRDAGIPVFDLLAKALGKSKEEVIALKDEGKLGGDALAAMMRALETGKGLERFNGLMAKQSKSLDGTWSTLKDTINMGLAGAVKPALPLVKDLVNVASDMAEKAMPKLRQGVKGAVGAVRDLMDSYKGGGFKEVLAGLSMKGAGDGGSGIAASIGKIGDSISRVDWGAVKDGLGEGVADTISVFGVAIGFAADHIDTFAKYLPLLVAGLVAWKVAQAAGNIAALAAVPLTVAQTVSNFALAGAMRAQTAATMTQTTATTGATVAQRGLNLALLANPIGLVIAAVALLVGGFILLYKKSDTFRALIDTIWNNLLKPFATFVGGVLLDGILMLASAYLRLGEYGVMAFRLLVTAAFMAFDKILGAAEVGLGWIPGMGDKIRGARAAFDEFGDKVINKLAAVEDKLRTTREKIDGIARDRSATIDISTRYTTVGSPTRGRPDEYGVPSDPRARAAGGPVSAGQPYIVGERRPELFVPRVDGVVLPRVPEAPPPTPTRFRSDRMPTSDVIVYLDGKQIAKNTAGHVTARVARQ